MNKQRILSWLIIIMMIALIGYVGSWFFLRAYSPMNRRIRISDYSRRLREQIITQAKEKYGYDWQKTVSIKDISVKDAKWFEINPNKWVFTVTFDNTDEEKEYKLANQKQRASTGLEFRELSYAQKGTIDFSQNEFTLVPSMYYSYEFSERWIDFKVISLSADQQKELVELFSKYRAVTTEEIAFEDNYRYTARFIIRFLDYNNRGLYSTGICIGRDGTEECYAVSSYSNHCYAIIDNSSELFKEVVMLLKAWGME